jgi:hypothetical protein
LDQASDANDRHGADLFSFLGTSSATRKGAGRVFLTHKDATSRFIVRTSDASRGETVLIFQDIS